MDIIKSARAEVRPPKPLVWMGGSKKDLLKLPSPVIDVFGYALYLAQTGGRHTDSRVLRGFGDPSGCGWQKHLSGVRGNEWEQQTQGIAQS
jgi:hypothetical protein